jgi:hypothetical protein
LSAWSAEVLFQGADLPAERRLGDVQLIGGAAEVQLVGDNYDSFSAYLRWALNRENMPG